MKQEAKQDQLAELCLAGAHFLENLYHKYLENPALINDSWRDYFEKFKENNHSDIDLQSPSNEVVASAGSLAQGLSPQAENINLKYKALLMIDAYIKKGHLLVALDPLNLEHLPTKEQLGLSPDNFGFAKSDLKTTIQIDYEPLNISVIELQKLIELLDKSYSSDIAIEYDYLINSKERDWLTGQMAYCDLSLSEQEEKAILKQLIETEEFEQYLHIKFPGAKRFSIEGSESALLAINNILYLLAQRGTHEVAIGMSHRGRVSSLCQIMQMPYKAMFHGFINGSIYETNKDFSGDVKYHLGYSRTKSYSSQDKYTDSNNQMQLKLLYNPSHLEAVNPVVAGYVRAKQDMLDPLKSSQGRKQVIGILVHGDSSFCGQGVVAETFSLANLAAYEVSGMIHFVVNNQLGFTADPQQTRNSRYSTDFAKIINAPVLHVNAENILAILKAVKIALLYRDSFAKDIVIEIIGYRKYGHNEGDEPSYTQALMYEIIRKKRSIANIYADKLIAEQKIDAAYLSMLRKNFKDYLDKEFEEASSYIISPPSQGESWDEYKIANISVDNLSTGVDKNKLIEIADKLFTIPINFNIHDKLTRLFTERYNKFKEGIIDWSMAEMLSIASLLTQDVPIRFIGQDVERGTFSQRHFILHSQTDNSNYTPLNNLQTSQSYLEISNSNLSEYAALGFEYGYSLADPRRLVIWEAQFGDFANGAQIIIDQFIVSAKAKWLQMSGLVLLLPHGYEGQGPEHSSARLERFLQLAANGNIIIAYPSVPASIFHLLRRQIYDKIRKPLIIMSPKSLLRRKQAISYLAELDQGSCFSLVLDDLGAVSDKINKIIFCSGKIYYDLLDKKNEQQITNIALIRLEQLYPFPRDELLDIAKRYSKAREFIWCQEEPQNMGAWFYIKDYLQEVITSLAPDCHLLYIGRDVAASPAAGSLKLHNQQQEMVINKALGLLV